MPVLRVVRPGMLTTVQDLGRWGHQISGVPVAGPMDEYSHRLANHLVGNAATAAALEVTLIGPELEADTDVLCAVAGALFTLHTDGGVAPMHEAFLLRRGARLRFGHRTAGARAALAVAGGLDVDPIFGSRATSLISRIGPFGGRAVMAGDVIPIAQSTAAARISRATPLTLPDGGARLRVIPGPHVSRFTSDAFDTLFAARYTVTPSSNRMGYRLEGSRLTHARGADILSDPTALGSLQVPASGQPILLMADRQTTGGYPKIATVISADLPLAGQLAPGDWVEFGACTTAEAVDALRRQRAQLERRTEVPDQE